MSQSCPSKVAITVDAWISSNQHAFFGVTAHWIDIEWNLRSRVLDVCWLIGWHTGDALAEELTSVLQQFGIIQKVSQLLIGKMNPTFDGCISSVYHQLIAIVTDNASNNETMTVGLMRICYNDLPWDFNPKNSLVCCFAHTLHLISLVPFEFSRLQWLG